MKNSIFHIFKMCLDNLCQRKFNAFTLAEVLVTLGIIGVVAAMTMPTLISNHQKTVYVTQLKKVYTELSQAAKRAINDSNAVSLDETRFNFNVAGASSNFLKTYFNVAQDCGTTLTPCFAESYKYINGTDFVVSEPQAAVSLASGASISVFENWFSYRDNGDHGYMNMNIDINGAAPPNIVGRDMFYIQLYSDGKVAEHYDIYLYDTIEQQFEQCLTREYNSYGRGCFSKIVADGWKMDY